MDIARSLGELLSPEKVSSNPTILEQHSHDESYHAPVLPDAVVFAESSLDVVRTVQFAAENQLSIVPFGAGSGLEGHVVPLKNGISLDLTRMNQILEICPDDLLVRVQPGVTRLQLNDALRAYGLFFPVDPGANATLGGMAATNASGTTCVRYGAMRDNVRSLQVVLADASVIQTSARTVKSSSGYNLTSLFVGSEGTLGIITELWLKVYGLPERIIAARVEFPDVESCVRTSTAVVGAGIPVARVELVDADFMTAINRYKMTSYPSVPTLFMEFHGNEAGILHDIELVKELAQSEGCMAFEELIREEDRNRMWEARHSAAHAFMAQYPGLWHMATDVCVPVSKLPEAVAHAKKVMAELDVDGAIVGHVGDGNFHISLALNRTDPDSMAQAQRLNEAVVKHALAAGGTCTGEHGVGIGKRKYQSAEHGAALAWMQAIKQLFDNGGMLNPGKLVDGLK